jgi:hypothetical protein
VATIRFAAGKSEGPHGSVWRLWATEKGDVYAAARAVAGKFKASLHVSGKWRFAVTKANVEGPEPLIDPSGDRAVHKWERPREFSPGLTRAMQIALAGVDVDCPPSKSSSGKVTWLEPPGKDEVGIFDVLLSRLPHSSDDWPGRAGMGTAPVFHTQLATEEVLWVLWRTEPATPEFWVHREQAVRQQLPPPGKRGELDNPTPSSRLIAGGEFGGMAMILDVSLSAVAKERMRYREELWRPDSAVQPGQFSQQMTAQLARSEGTVMFRYTLSQAIPEPPPQPTTILETPPDAEVEASLEVNPQMELVFSRAGRKVKLALAPLRGGAVLQIFLAWGRSELALHAGATDLQAELIHASTSW